MYGVKNIIVAHPRTVTADEFPTELPVTSLKNKRSFCFFFPAYPRPFKNAEVLLEAARLLQDHPMEIWLTFSGSDGRYARNLVRRYGDLRNVKFLGKLSRQEVFERYEIADCLVFPSLLETWGLPISEFKTTGKPMLLANLPYAHETLGTYSNAHFFDPRNTRELTKLMQVILYGMLEASQVVPDDIAQPYAAGWKELFGLLLP
jgi:glycosyltransferase involved in cell wall biosynthesis